MENLIALIAATVILILIPGPNVALIVANSLRHGLRTGVVTSLGTTVGIGLQLLLVVSGLAVLLQVAADALTWIKWLGVAYLLWLGVRTWREPPDDLTAVKAQSNSGAFLRGMLLAVVNPKTLLFNAAFLPQFVVSGGNAASGLLVVASVYLAVLLVGDALWAVFAASARRWLGRFGRLRNRLIGAFLTGAGISLAVSHRSI